MFQLLQLINHLSIPQVFQEVEHRVDHTFSVHLSFLEIYNETMVDLLSSLKQGKDSHSGVLTVVEEPGGGVSVKGLSLHLVHNEEEALNLLFEVRGKVMRYFISLFKKCIFYLSKNSLFPVNRILIRLCLPVKGKGLFLSLNTAVDKLANEKQYDITTGNLH